MSPFRNALAGAAAAVCVASMPAHAAVQCVGLAPGDPSRQEFTVYFDVGSAQIDEAARAVVQRAARQATATFKSEICLIGRTSPTGSPQANQRLAQQRIQAVQNALVQRGVRRETLGSAVQGAAFGMRQDRTENRADRSVTIILVR